MGLSKSQQVLWERVRSAGSGAQAVRLADDVCSYLIAVVVLDLGLSSEFPELPKAVQDFFSFGDLKELAIPQVDALPLFERLTIIDPNAEMYFACLASLHKARLKYEIILETQPLPTLEQVGPRGLLQFGKLAPRNLVGLLFWRKWFFDIDNRAGQETGYLFEPVIAHAIGGTPVPAQKSPVKRVRDKRRGRQIDCLIADRAYEFKIRLTIAASGQGRWREELDYPKDCRRSGLTPVLVVLDSTPNPKLTELDLVFRKYKGEVYVGSAAWDHLAALAGPTLSVFLQKYIRKPIESLAHNSVEQLPDLTARQATDTIQLEIGGEPLAIKRRPRVQDDDATADEIPTDVDEGLPG